jgi:hypothetical protein
MANYSSKFVKDYAAITEPLRQLTRKSIRFTWTHKHQAAYDKLKHTLLNSPVMSYFDTSKETSILVRDQVPCRVLTTKYITEQTKYM